MEMLYNTSLMAQTFISLFIAIVFLQSGLDKVMNWNGNHSWIKEHFSKSILSSFSTPMFIILTITEVATGVLALIGIFCLWLYNDSSCTYLSVLLSLLSYIMLIFGQRIVQDYEGAKTIAIYFGISLLSLMFFAL